MRWPYRNYSLLVVTGNLSTLIEPSSENPGGSDELVSRPVARQTGLLKATIHRNLLARQVFYRKSFIVS
jgi:hypothetical protein